MDGSRRPKPVAAASPERRHGDGQGRDELPPLLRGLQERIKNLGTQMEKMNLAEYAALFEDPRRLWWIHFTSGIARGLGIAIGFTLLGAVMIYFMQRAVMLNLPVIGEFIAQIVRIVQNRMDVSPGP
ncbi:MAG: DUF5665 domain-containing protein [Thermaerobacterales bacterium]